MFGMMRKKPSKQKAMKELKKHAAMFGLLVAVVRVTPYVLSYFQHEELRLDL